MTESELLREKITELDAQIFRLKGSMNKEAEAVMSPRNQPRSETSTVASTETNTRTITWQWPGQSSGPFSSPGSITILASCAASAQAANGASVTSWFHRVSR